MTKIWICIFVTATAMVAADKPAARKSSGSAAAPAKAARKAPPALTLPKGAVQTGPATWEYTAPDGKKWIYRKTPFGLTRLEDKPEVVSAERKEESPIKAFEDGDSVRFERPGPFGTYKWTRKKTDLDDTERQAWERSRGAASEPAGKQEQSER